MRQLVGVFMALSMILVVANVAAADGSTAGAPRLATLSGGAEVGGGDADGSGFASIRLNVGRGRVCWDISFADIDAPFAAHIHVGAAGVNGPVVVPLNPNTPGCNEADPELIQAIIDFPANYYVNVHNTPFPGGAIRGQLSNPGLA